MRVPPLLILLVLLGCDPANTSQLEDSPPRPRVTSADDVRRCLHKLEGEPFERSRRFVFDCAAKAFSAPRCASSFEALSRITEPTPTQDAGTQTLFTCSQSYCDALPHGLCELDLVALRALEHAELRERATTTYAALLKHELGDADAAWIEETAHLFSRASLPRALGGITVTDVTVPEPSSAQPHLRVVISAEGITVVQSGKPLPSRGGCSATLCLTGQRYDWEGFQALLTELKDSSPAWKKHTRIELAASSDIAFEAVVKTMDMARTRAGSKEPLFPEAVLVTAH